MKIILWPDPRLKKVSETVTQENLPPDEFFQEMLATMRAAGGVGLSAVQVGVHLRVVVMETGEGGTEIMVNPMIINLNGDRKLIREGCLSVPNQFEKVLRYQDIDFAYQTPEQIRQGGSLHPGPPTDTKTTYCQAGKALGLRAQCIQHELEHLDGKMFVDHLKPADRSRIQGAMLKLKKGGRR